MGFNCCSTYLQVCNTTTLHTVDVAPLHYCYANARHGDGMSASGTSASKCVGPSRHKGLLPWNVKGRFVETHKGTFLLQSALLTLWLCHIVADSAIALFSALRASGARLFYKDASHSLVIGSRGGSVILFEQLADLSHCQQIFNHGTDAKERQAGRTTWSRSTRCVQQQQF